MTVLAGGAVKSAFEAAAIPWQRETGHAVKAQYAPAGEIRNRLAAGERPDVLVVPAEALFGLEREGLVDCASRRDLAVVSIGLAVRKARALRTSRRPRS